MGLLALTGCAFSRTVADSWAVQQNAKPQGVLSDINAVVTSAPVPLESSSLQGAVFEASWDGLTLPVVCLSEMDATCLRFREGTPIRIDKAHLRSGVIEVAGAVHGTYLELMACRERR